MVIMGCFAVITYGFQAKKYVFYCYFLGFYYISTLKNHLKNINFFLSFLSVKSSFVFSSINNQHELRVVAMAIGLITLSLICPFLWSVSNQRFGIGFAVWINSVQFQIRCQSFATERAVMANCIMFLQPVVCSRPCPV